MRRIPQYYPNVTLRIERILVQTGSAQSLFCSGGASSWQDLALLLIAKHGGTEEAIRMSKLFLYQWHRDGQLPYASMIQNVNHGDAVIMHCQQWIAKHYDRQDIIAELRESGLPCAVSPPIPRRDGLFAAVVCRHFVEKPNNCSKRAPWPWSRLVTKSAMKMLLPSAGCSASSPA
jgi:hypothetical protein